jgi:hypothetical protein
MERITDHRVDPTNYGHDRLLAYQYFGRRSYVACRRKDAELAVTLTWNVKWAKHKQKTYYFTTMY